MTDADSVDNDVHVQVPANAAVVATFDDEQAPDFSVLTYWHQPSDGSDGYVMVEIEDCNATSGGEPRTAVRVRHNEGAVYDWKTP